MIYLSNDWTLFMASYARFCKIFQDRGKKSKKILGIHGEKIENIQDLGKKFKIIQDYPRFWLENQDAKHWV